MKYLFSFLVAVMLMQPLSAFAQEDAGVAAEPSAPVETLAPDAGFKPVRISDTSLKLPHIEGFRELYGQSPAFDELISQFVPATNRVLAVYISEEDMQKMEADPESGFKRYILVQTLRQDVRIASDADFQSFREEYFRQLEDTSTFKDPKIDETFDKATAYLEKNYDSGAQVRLGEVRNLGPLADAINRVGIMLVSDYGLKTEEGTKSYPVAAATMALNLAGRIVFVYAYSSDFKGQEDIDYIKDVAWRYTEETFGINSLSADVSQYPPVEAKGMNSTLRATLVGALVGGIIAALLKVFRRRRNDRAV